MQSIFIGKNEKQLYGVVQEPAGNTFEDYAVLMCYPFGQEYMRSHRAFRQLSSMLSRKGIASLRFDYLGTGDSMGDQSDFTIEQACDDIKRAYKELKTLSAVDKIYVVGLRLGAAMAAMALGAEKGTHHISLWDPVINGQAYCDELYRSMDPERYGDLIVDDVWWVNGFPVSPALRKELAAIDLCKASFAKQCQLLQVVSKEKPEFADFKSHCESNSVKFKHDFQQGPSDDDWNEVDAEGSFLLPHAVLNSIVETITQR